MVSYTVVFFFFKQKTAYEMRISDWSSDVCSSDLPAASSRIASVGPSIHRLSLLTTSTGASPSRSRACIRPPPVSIRRSRSFDTTISMPLIRFLRRSEEHTSELQSLMRFSYAVFCLKQKTHMHRISRLLLNTNTTH